MVETVAAKRCSNLINVKNVLRNLNYFNALKLDLFDQYFFIFTLN